MAEEKSYDLNVLSLGAGVQSSTVALMIEAGELPRVDCAIFADTGAEPQGVYRWLDYLEAQLSFPVVRVMQGEGLTKAALTPRMSKKGIPYLRVSIPMFSLASDGKHGMLPRKCSRDYKVAPLRREGRRRMKEAGLKGLRQWIGISLDEAHRMRDSDRKYITHHYPLIDRGMTRKDCLRWMKDQGYPQPPRSACVYCPFHADSEWKRLASREPGAFDAAVEFEKKIRQTLKTDDKTYSSSQVFLHASRVDLEKAEFDNRNQLDLFGNECEGMCGL